MERIAPTLVALAERIARALRVPRVRALHLPCDGAQSGKDAEFGVLELEDGCCGFTYVWLGDTLSDIRAGGLRDRLSGRDPLEIARGFHSANPVSRALGMAAINAISQHLFRRAGWSPPEAGDSLGRVDPQPKERIGMIGFFPPLVPRVVEAGARLTVLELRAEMAGEWEGYRVTLDAAELRGCQKVISTSTVLLNDTLDSVLAACRGARYFAMIGPTAGCVPDPLFARGVSLLGGTEVIDLPGLRVALQTGKPWGRYTRKYAIRRQEYPGVDGLLERAG